MGDTANLHKGQQVTIIVAPLVLISLTIKRDSGEILKILKENKAEYGAVQMYNKLFPNIAFTETEVSAITW